MTGYDDITEEERVFGAFGLLVNAARVSPPLRDAVRTVEDSWRSLRVQLNEARSERDAHVDARTQMWVALANIRDACGEGSFFHRQAVAAIGNAEDPDHPVQRAVEARRRLAANVGAARAEVERLRAALERIAGPDDGCLRCTVSNEPNQPGSACQYAPGGSGTAPRQETNSADPS